MWCSLTESVRVKWFIDITAVSHFCLSLLQSPSFFLVLSLVSVFCFLRVRTRSPLRVPLYFALPVSRSLALCHCHSILVLALSLAYFLVLFFPSAFLSVSAVYFLLPMFSLTSHMEAASGASVELFPGSLFTVKCRPRTPVDNFFVRNPRIRNAHYHIRLHLGRYV